MIHALLDDKSWPIAPSSLLLLCAPSASAESNSVSPISAHKPTRSLAPSHLCWLQRQRSASVLNITLHKVFGPNGPFLHSGLSVLPQVTQTCNPSLSPPAAPMEAFLSLFFSLAAGSLGGLPGLAGLGREMSGLTLVR